MSFTLTLSFPAGRYHATGWGRHVNEAAPEWPPASWRILRALVAVWKRTLANDVFVNTHLPSVLAKLTNPPQYKLPPASVGHTRHYLAGASSLVFDGFISVLASSEIGVHWADAQLSMNEQQALSNVLDRLNYLGRSESWCNASICDDWQTFPGEICLPVAIADSGALNNSSKKTETIRLLCLNPQTWNIWSYKKGYRPNPAWNLLAETLNMHNEGWSDPAGSSWVSYSRSAQALVPAPTRRYRINDLETKPQTVEFALDGSVLPLVADTVYIAELARQRLQGIYGRLFDGMASSVFSGKQPDGSLSNQHLHAFFLPYDKDGDGRLDHLMIYSPQGFDTKEMRCMDVWRETRGAGSLELNVLLLGIDNPKLLLFATATRWRSITPFIATRHYKQRGTKRDVFPREQLAEMNLREELSRRNLPTPISITAVNGLNLTNAGRTLPWREFRQQRVLGEGRRGSESGKGFEIEFAQPVA
ncbi:MAG: type I-U CRISPR-associated protein Csb2, partial [Chloroflexota bacterium]